VAFLAVSTDLGRGVLVPRLVRAADDALAGSIRLRGFHLLAQGGVELLGAQVIDPDGDVVLSVERARVTLDVARLRARNVGVMVELDGPALVLKREEDGSLSLARAFAPTRPRAPDASSGELSWTIRATRVSIRGGSVRYVDASGQTKVVVEGVAADGRGGWGPRGGGAQLSAHGELTSPERAPVDLALRASVRGPAVRVSQLRAAVGETAIEVLGSGDLATWKGRAVVLALSVDAEALRAVAPRSPLASDLAGTLYAESDGQLATAALDLAPRGGGGTARASSALRLPPAGFAAGADLQVAGLDLSKVLRGAPSSALTVDAHARAAGADVASLRGGGFVSVAPSRLRGGRVQSLEARAVVDRGAWELQRLDAVLPGATLSARGRWRRGGQVVGQLSADAPDLRALRGNLAALLDRPLPPVTGAARVDATLSGSEDAPAAAVHVAAPTLATGEVAATGVALDARLAGALAAPSVELSANAAGVTASGVEARAVQVRATWRGRSGEATLTASVPEIGPDPVSAYARVALSPGNDQLDVDGLTLAWPGDRFALVAPARVTLAGPSVDRLALADGPQRIALSGGLAGEGRRRALDARLEVAALDLDRLPRALLPPRLGLAGRLSAEVTARGASAAPEIAGHVDLADGAVAGVGGLALAGEVAWDGGHRRARVDLAGRRAAGGELTVRADLPVPPGRAAAGERLAVDAALRGVPVDDALRLAGRPEAEDVGGVASAALQLSGTVGAPALTASAALERGRYQEVEGLALALDLGDPGRRARLTARLDRVGLRVAEADVTVPLDLAALLRQPAPTAGALPDAPLQGSVTIPGLDLATIAGLQRVPPDLRGRLAARADLAGTLRAPRGKVGAAVTDGALGGYRAIAASLEAEAGDHETSLSGKAALAGEEVLRFAGRVGLPLERLGDGSAREAAAVSARVEVPRADLRRADAPLPLAGEVVGTAELSGTLSAPLASLRASGKRLEIAGRPLGDVDVTGRADARTLHAGLLLAVPMGGTLSGKLDADTGVGADALRRGDVLRAPARASLVASALDLGFVPAVAPGLVRSASGKLGLDLVAAGPLGRLAPRGTTTLAGGKLAVTEYGEWSDLNLSASLTDDVFRIDRFTGQGRKGQFDLQGEVKGLARRDAPADVKAALRTNGLSVTRAGDVLATVTLNASMTGTLARERLDAEIRVARAEVRLPPRISSRNIQPLSARPDVVIGPFAMPGARAQPSVAGMTRERPFEAKVRLIAPNGIIVLGENPRVNIEAKADVTGEWSDGTLDLSGVVETLRGDVEPLGGRVFEVKRARVTFTGGEWQEGDLDVNATWTNPIATVTVGVTGTLSKPEVKFSSQPSLDDTQIALLIATGSRTELLPGTGGVANPLATGSQVAASTLSSIFVKEVLADKLPVDTVSIDASQLRAGKYLGPKLYVGYTYKWTAKPELGENYNEVRLQYQISPRWNFELRAGDSGTGGGSLIWSKDY
jgi:translocation and assembly module TamB